MVRVREIRFSLAGICRKHKVYHSNHTNEFPNFKLLGIKSFVTQFQPVD